MDWQQPRVKKSRRKTALKLITLLVLVAIGFGLWALLFWTPPTNTEDKQPDTKSTSISSTASPQLKTQILVEGRTNVWDLAFLPSKELLFSERGGDISLLSNGQIKKVMTISDVNARGEGGLLGLAVDPEFSSNRFVYTCYNTAGDIRVVRFKLTSDQTSLTDRKDIITGIPRNQSGRHSGCRVAFGPDSALWVTTGDTAQNLTPQSPQDPKSLAGKILRVTREGTAAPGNLSGEFDPRIYSFGHRNVQGIAFFDKPLNGILGVSAEHGSTIDDELNLLKSGNFGWAPPNGPYSEAGVSMTDKQRFPDAIEALWSSGSTTQAPSGITVLSGSQWGTWDGAVAMAILKDRHLKIFLLDDTPKVVKEERHLANEFGRIRAAVQGPDGFLYITTDNGSGQDKIVRITPQL